MRGGDMVGRTRNPSVIWQTSGLLALAFLIGGCVAEPAGEGDLAAAEAAVASSTRFVVDRTNDSNDGSCGLGIASSGRCNLRAAVQAAASVPGAVEIALGVDATVDTGEIVIAARPDGAPLRIVAAAGRAIVGAGHARLFTVDAGATLTLRGVRVSGFAAYDGGAIANRGRLELDGASFADNHATCSGVGAMTAFATCSGGAIASSGQLTLSGGTRFEHNSVDAGAYTASFTTSSASGGAIASSGTIVVDGAVAFADNSAAATSFSGAHPIPVSDAWASAAGGAIYSAGGSLVFTDRATGGCSFSGNAARAAATPYHAGPGTATSSGGAIYSLGQLIMAPDACTFEGDQALTDPDVHAEPAAVPPGVRARLDEATQSIVFTASDPVAWVDLHLAINGARTTNVRMQAGAAGSFVVGPLALRADDELAYSFTYFAAGAAHDSFTYTRTVPLTFEPRAFRPEVRSTLTDGAYLVRLVSNAPVDWADVHYSVNGGAPANLRLHDVGGSTGQVITLAANDQLSYWMTYAANGHVLETGVYDFHPSAPTAATMWTHGFPVDDPAHPGAIPAGCMASGSWYTCEPLGFSRVSTSGSYRFADDAALVPFGIIGTGPYGTSLVKTLRVAFSAPAGGPRTGTGLVQLPSSAAAEGVPPLDEADRDRGKFVSPAWNLRASYLVGGEGLSVALVDVNGLRSNAVDLSSYRSSYCRYGCSLKVPVSVLVAGTDVDLSQIRYLELRTESGITSDPTLVVGHLLFDDFPY
jgi:hypothetical protein